MTEIQQHETRHTTTAPDTLDPAEWARLAIRGIGGAIDPDARQTMVPISLNALDNPRKEPPCLP